MKTTDFLTTICERETSYSAFVLINARIAGLNIVAGTGHQTREIMKSKR